MGEDRFQHMRPFLDAEVPKAIERLMGEKALHTALEAFMGVDQAQWALEQAKRVNSIFEFQDHISRPLVKHILDTTASEVTFSFPDGFDPVGALFISNHRDIVLDPALINLALSDQGAPTTEIGIGSNLLGLSWVRDVVRLNRSFVVPRGGGPRQQLQASADVAAYVRSVVLENQRSVWLAQREGRAKDGNDLTSPALIRMLLDGGGEEMWSALRVHAVSLSYEWDPCDAMKVRELLIRHAQGGEYQKVAGEDEKSMRKGLLEWKGRIHISFSAPLAWEEGPERNHVRMASVVDECIHRQLRPFDNAAYAAHLIGEAGVSPKILSDESIGEACEERLASVVEEVQLNTAFTQEEIRTVWCQMMARPWVNAQHSKMSSAISG